MRKSLQFILLVFFASIATKSFCLDERDLVVYDIAAFDNFSIIQPDQVAQTFIPSIDNTSISPSDHLINKLIDDQEVIVREAFAGEPIFIGLLLENINSDAPLSIEAKSRFSKESILSPHVNVSLVSKWKQGGIDSTQSAKFSVLTYELLLTDDRSLNLNDGWSHDGQKWWYIPPDIPKSTSSGVYTDIAPMNNKRLLVEIAVPKNLPAGDYKFFLSVSDLSQGKLLKEIPFLIKVHPVSLDYALIEEYDLFIYTKLALDPQVARRNAYDNSQHSVGDQDYQKQLLRKHAENIRRHGFNGVVALDWRAPYLESALQIYKQAGIRDVIVYGRTPVEAPNSVEAIIAPETIRTIESIGFAPLFYGEDEAGGNSLLAEQIMLNQRINLLGGGSVNACFWDDRSNVIKAASGSGEIFSHLAYSMGSHGDRDFFESLPIKKEAFRQLAYWHPNVENPIRNRIFSGFWLWASGLDGIMPHIYMSLPHIARFDSSERELASPYNDFSLWDASGTYRHHQTVYPSKDGFVDTLQWRAFKEGVTDLVLVTQLETILDSMAAQSAAKDQAVVLLSEIKSDMLTIKSSYFNESRVNYFQKKASEWRYRLKQSILELGGGLSNSKLISPPAAPPEISAVPN